MLKSFLIDCSNGFGKISVYFLVLYINLLWIIILDDPRKNRVLREITERAVSCLIKMHQIIEVWYLSVLPQHGNIFKLIDFNTFSWHSFCQHWVNFVSELLIIKGKIIRFISYDLKADLSYKNKIYFTKFISTFEKLLYLGNLDFINSIARKVMKRFKVHFFISNKEISINCVKRQYSMC